MDFIKTIAEETDTRKSDWAFIDGPESGIGVDYWMMNKNDDREVYINIDQDEVTISYTEQE